MSGLKIKLNPQLKDHLTEVRRNIREGGDGLLYDVTMELHWRLSRRTPVATGRTRGNWRVGINKPDLHTDINAFDPTGENGAAEAREIARNIKAGDQVFITNALPWVKRLNAGSSKKAPAGFIEQTAAELPLIARKIVEGYARQLHGRDERVVDPGLGT